MKIPAPVLLAAIAATLITGCSDEYVQYHGKKCKVLSGNYCGYSIECRDGERWTCATNFKELK